MKHQNGILLVYHHPLRPNAPTIMEHVESLPRYSRFPVWRVNTVCGFPSSLSNLQFDAIVLHYSLFGQWPFDLGNEFGEYLSRCEDSYKIAFFQDEYRFWPQRATFVNECRINSVYTLLKPQEFESTYRKYCPDVSLHYTIPGFVDDRLIQLAQKYQNPQPRRTIDIGYRTRELPIYMGMGAREKHDIGVIFKQRAKGLGLTLDIETAEAKRIYGDAWYKRFLANCRGVLGVEAGVSIFDVDNDAFPQYESIKTIRPQMSDEEVHHKLLRRHEDKVYYRMISPRHFEAAAFNTCQILFEGQYSGILKPNVHYIALKKDFSNFDEVIRCFRDEHRRRELTETAKTDLIHSGRYDYRKFAREFDDRLIAQGLHPRKSADEKTHVQRILDQDRNKRQFQALYGSFKARTARRRSVNQRLICATAKPLLWLKSCTRKLDFC